MTDKSAVNEEKPSGNVFTWTPLESNPEVMTKFLHTLGVPKQWGIVDVYGFDAELLALLPKPVLAVILLYPISVKLNTQDSESGNNGPSAVYHINQYIGNACGTIALIHSVANNLDRINLNDGFLKKFLDETKDLSSSDRGMHLVNAGDISKMHQESAMEGQTEAPGQSTPIDYHFVALIHKNGTLYELDGRKDAPINHGATSPETFLNDAGRVCKDYMAQNPEEVRFTVVALTATE